MVSGTRRRRILILPPNQRHCLWFDGLSLECKPLNRMFTYMYSLDFRKPESLPDSLMGLDFLHSEAYAYIPGGLMYIHPALYWLDYILKFNRYFRLKLCTDVCTCTLEIGQCASRSNFLQFKSYYTATLLTP